MQFSIWYVAGTLVGGFVLGAVIMFGCDRAKLRRFHKSAKLANFTANTLADACRKVLSDAWFRKVMREYKREISEYAAKEAK